MNTRLFVINPPLQKIFYEFNNRYMDFRMIDLDHLKSLMPITITDLKNIVLEQIDMNKKYLRETWLRQCADIISDDKESIEKLTPSYDKVNIN